MFLSSEKLNLCKNEGNDPNEGEYENTGDYEGCRWKYVFGDLEGA